MREAGEGVTVAKYGVVIVVTRFVIVTPGPAKIVRLVTYITWLLFYIWNYDPNIFLNVSTAA